jgi:flagellar biosynthesis chaperone FliJ
MAKEALEERRVDDDQAERERSIAAIRRRSVERLAERRKTVSVRAAATASQRSLDELAVLRRAQP